MPPSPARIRPTSPHLGIYRWQIGNTLSILHRLTGVALALGLIALCYWFVALASGPEVYAAAIHRAFQQALPGFMDYPSGAPHATETLAETPSTTR